MMDDYGVTRVRAVATSAVREAANAETFLDRVRVRTGLDVEVIDGSEESRLTYLAVSERLHGHPALAAALHAAGGSRRRQRRRDAARARRSRFRPASTRSASIRMRQRLGDWQRLARAAHPAALRPDRERRRRHRRRDAGRDAELRRRARQRHALRRVAARRGRSTTASCEMSREAFIGFVAELAKRDEDAARRSVSALAGRGGDARAGDAGVPRAASSSRGAATIVVPDVSLRDGAAARPGWRGDRRGPTSRPHVLASAATLGARYRYDALHARRGGAARDQAVRPARRRSTGWPARPAAARGGRAAARHRPVREPARASQALACICCRRPRSSA